MKHVIAIPGSTRARSTHKNLIRTISGMAEGLFSVELFDGIDTLPHFNPDLDTEDPPSAVAHFRRQLREADGVLICTPEYAMGVPGTLKNALDWTVSSAEFYRKPTALITASSQGYKGHAALMETLTIIGCAMTEGTGLIIPFIKTKVGQDGGITDAETEVRIRELITEFGRLLP
jgi:NAD(P)H-dependent FMN reductase